MGAYIYRLTKKSNAAQIQLPDGTITTCGSLAFAYKPFINWDGKCVNQRYENLAVAAVRRSWKNERPTHVVIGEKVELGQAVIIWGETQDTINDYSNQYQKGEVGYIFAYDPTRDVYIVGSLKAAQEGLEARCAVEGHGPWRRTWNADDGERRVCERCELGNQIHTEPLPSEAQEWAENRFKELLPPPLRQGGAE